MDDNQILAYLDHNVLDLMTKDDPHQVKELLKEHGLTPVYSEETLKEIQRSTGFENKYLELLDEIGAKYIEPILDQNYKLTGQASLDLVKPKDLYERFLRRQLEVFYGDFGASEMLMKIYGGQPDRSSEEILCQGAIDLKRYLNKVLEDVEKDLLDEDIDMQSIKMNFDAVISQYSEMVDGFDEVEELTVSAFEVETGIGPKILKNVKPPNVVEKIWKMLSDVDDFSGVDMENFWGGVSHDSEDESGREITVQEKVNSIYHQLNFLGYYRDSKMKKDRRFHASFSDMTHAGVALFCHLFLSRDEDLVMKAAAAYEYLGVNTKIFHYKGAG